MQTKEKIQQKKIKPSANAHMGRKKKRKRKKMLNLWINSRPAKEADEKSPK